MYNYDERQISAASRRFNDIKSCEIVKIDERYGLTFRLPWGNETAQIKPMDFEIGKYKVGEWIDLRLYTVCGQNRISLKSVQFIGRTPNVFIPKK